MSLLTLFHLIEKLTEQEIILCIENITLEIHKQLFIKILKCVNDYEEEEKNQILLNWEIDESTIHELISKIIEIAQTLEYAPWQKTVNIISKCKFLFNRNLYDTCITYLDEAKTLAVKFEYFELLVTISAIEINLKKRGFLSSNHNPKNDAVHYNYMASNYRAYIGFQYSLERQRSLIEGAETKYLEQYKQKPLLRNESAARSIKAKFLYYEIRAKICYLLDEEEEAYYLIEQLLNLYKKHKHFLEVPGHRSKYVNTVGNYFSLSKNLGKEEKAFEEIKAIMTIAEEQQHNVGYHQMARQVFSISYIEQLKQFWQEKAYQQIVELIPDIEELFEKEIFLSYKCQAYRFFAYAYYYKGRAIDSLQWCESILDAYGKLISQDLKSVVLQLKLILLYEANKINLLQEEIEKTKQFNHQERRQGRFENLFINFITVLVEQGKNKEQELCQEYLRLFEALANEVRTKNHIDYFDIKTWIKKRL